MPKDEVSEYKSRISEMVTHEFKAVWWDGAIRIKKNKT